MESLTSEHFRAPIDWRSCRLATPRARRTGGGVYVIGCRRTGLVKIGFTRDFGERFAAIQANCATPLEVFVLLDGGREEEARLHARLHHRRVHHEFFQWGDGVEVMSLLLRVLTEADEIENLPPLVAALMYLTESRSTIEAILRSPSLAPRDAMTAIVTTVKASLAQPDLARIGETAATVCDDALRALSRRRQCLDEADGARPHPSWAFIPTRDDDERFVSAFVSKTVAEYQRLRSEDLCDECRASA